MPPHGHHGGGHHGGGHHGGHHGGGPGWGGGPWWGQYPQTEIVYVEDCIRDPRDLSRCLPPRYQPMGMPGAGTVVGVGVVGMLLPVVTIGVVAYFLLRKKKR